MIQTVHPTTTDSPIDIPKTPSPYLPPAQSSNKLDASPTQFVGFANYAVWLYATSTRPIKLPTGPACPLSRRLVHAPRHAGTEIVREATNCELCVSGVTQSPGRLPFFPSPVAVSSNKPETHPAILGGRLRHGAISRVLPCLVCVTPRMPCLLQQPHQRLTPHHYHWH